MCSRGLEEGLAKESNWASLTNLTGHNAAVYAGLVGKALPQVVFFSLFPSFLFSFFFQAQPTWLREVAATQPSGLQYSLKLPVLLSIIDR